MHTHYHASEIDTTWIVH